jgi:hypothetical protein
MVSLENRFTFTENAMIEVPIYKCHVFIITFQKASEGVEFYNDRSIVYNY